MNNNIKVGDLLTEDFKVVEQIGGIENGNSFGDVFIIYSSSMNKFLVLKKLQDRFSKLEDNRFNEKMDNFKKEALAWTELNNHPNIVFASAGIFKNNLCIIMEPIPPNENGDNTLQDYMNHGLDDYTILDWSIQFCYGMEYANSNGIEAHRDIKPTNILINFDNILKIADFGLVKLSKENHLNEILIDNQSDINYHDYVAPGTIAYLAPECFNGISNKQTDIYSFGWVLYQMMNEGKLPYANNIFNTDEEWIDFKNTYEPPSLNSNFYHIIKKCLEKNPENRYKSFADLRKDLEKVFVEKFDKKPYTPKFDNTPEFNFLSKAHAYSSLRYKKEAINFFEKSIQSNHEYYQARIEYSVQLIKWNKNNESLPHLNKAKELYEKGMEKSLLEKTRIYFNLGHAYQNLNDNEKAIKNYEKAMDLNPTFYKSFVNLGNIYRDLNEYDKAEELYDYVLENNPQFYEALINKGILHSKKGNKKDFEYYFKQAEKINDSFKLNQLMGQEYATQKDWGKALSKFSKAISKDPENPEPHLSTLYLYLEIKNNLALQKSKEILEKFNDNDDVKFKVAALLEMYSYNNEALTIYDDLISSNSSLKIKALIKKSHILNEINNKEFDTIKCCNEVLDLIKNDNLTLSSIWNNKGYAYLKLHFHEDAINCFTKSLKYNPKNISSIMNQGSIYGEKGNHILASCFFEDALKIDENNPEILYLIATAQMNLGEYDEALISCNNSLKLNNNSTKVQELKESILKNIEEYNG